MSEYVDSEYPQLNEELWDRVKATILEEPKRLRMRLWGITKKRGPLFFQDEKNTPACGTVGCLAGWACVLNATKAPSRFQRVMGELLKRGIDEDTFDFAREAEKVLGLAYDEGKMLFERGPHIGAYNDGTRKSARAIVKIVNEFLREARIRRGLRPTRARRVARRKAAATA